MPLASGIRLGPYEIVAPIGAGGMGEVYRARDTKLKRDVALKVLPEAFASDPQRMTRFQREAEVLASLNHPNIAAIYGVEDHALIMELVEGDSPKGPMPFDEAWHIASQIVTALEYAHEKGIIHRDLKPANVKITPEGVVKLLDFGLAKAFTNQNEPSANAENSPTLTIGATEVGMILGTAAYMSPEQAKGKSVDKRADIWAFGVVLYELLTGVRPFKGEDVPETLAQVLTKEPDLAKAPRKAQRLLRRCLEKDPKKRLRDIGEARYLGDEAPQVQARPSKLPWSVAAVLAVIAVGVSFLHFHQTPPAGPVLRYTISAPENAINLHSFTVSPDGHLLAMAADVNGRRQLWLRPLDALQARSLPGTDDATFPFWSPDSRYIGFFAQDKLKKIAASGGPPQSLCDAPDGHGGTWNRGDMIVFSPNGGAGGTIQRVFAGGGVPVDVTKPQGVSRFPVFLPDGRHFFYLVTGGSAERNGVYLSSLDGKENRRILPDVSSVVFGASRLLFIRDNTLTSQPFDGRSSQTVGDAFPVVEGVSFGTVGSLAPVTVSETGVLLYESGAVTNGNQMAWYDRSGKRLEAVGMPGPVWDLAISPDEKSVAFRRQTVSRSDLWLRDLTRGAEQRISFDPSFNTSPFWSPSGDRVVFRSTRSGPGSLYQKAASGTGQDELLLADGNNMVPTHWSQDGRFIVYSEFDPKTKWDVWVLPMGGGAARKPGPFLRTEFNELFGQISSDSRWMAYTSDVTGQREVYVRSFPSGEGQRKISIAGGEQPRWRGDGQELFFVGGDGKMMAVAVKAMVGTKPSFEPGIPQPLFEAHLVQSYNGSLFEYDVTADGKRFLLDTVGGGSPSAPMLNVVLNWDAGLKK